MITRNSVGGIIVTIIGAIYLYYAMQIRVSALSDTFGPRGMPVIYGWLTVGLGLLLLAQSVLEVVRLDADRRKELFRKEWDGQGEMVLRAAGLLVIAIAFLFVFNYLGYAVTLAALIAAVAAYMGARVDLRLFAIAIGGALVMWLIFVVLLDVRMPQGILATLAQ